MSAFSPVQEVGGALQFSYGHSLTFPNAVVVGDTLALVGSASRFGQTTGIPTAGLTVSDSINGAWTLLPISEYVGAGNYYVCTWCAFLQGTKAAGAGALTVTVGFTTTPNGDANGVAVEYGGLSTTTAPLHGTPLVSVINAASGTSPAVADTQAGDLVLGWMGCYGPNAVTAGSGATLIGSSAAAGDSGVGLAQLGADSINGNNSVNLAQNVSTYAQLGTIIFRAASGGGTTYTDNPAGQASASGSATSTLTYAGSPAATAGASASAQTTLAYTSAPSAVASPSGSLASALGFTSTPAAASLATVQTTDSITYADAPTGAATPTGTCSSIYTHGTVYSDSPSAVASPSGIAANSLRFNNTASAHGGSGMVASSVSYTGTPTGSAQPSGSSGAILHYPSAPAAAVTPTGNATSAIRYSGTPAGLPEPSATAASAIVYSDDPAVFANATGSVMSSVHGAFVALQGPSSVSFARAGATVGKARLGPTVEIRQSNKITVQ